MCGVGLRNPRRPSGVKEGMRTQRASVLVGFVLMTLLGCTSDGSVVTSATSSDTAASASSGDLTARVELPARTMRAGTTMDAVVVVQNDSGAPVMTTGCGSLFQIALITSGETPEIAWALCLQNFTIPIGESRYPMTITAEARGCGGEPAGQRPACVDGHEPALPPGEYEAALFQSSPVVTLPAPVPIEVTS